MRNYFLISILLLASSCTQQLYPPTDNFVNIFTGGQEYMQVRVEPYINAMPGAVSNDVIIGIHFYLNNAEGEHIWPRKFKITKIDVWGVADRFTELDDLDHNEWMHNTLEKEDRNVLRIPMEHAQLEFDLTLWFKDDTGKRYKAVFRRLGAGLVH